MISELSYYMYIPLEFKRIRVSRVTFSLRHLFLYTYSVGSVLSCLLLIHHVHKCSYCGFISPHVYHVSSNHEIISTLDIRWPLVIHNIICTILSAYCLMCFIIAFTEDRDLFSTTTSSTGILRHAMFIYRMTKWYELLDTVFMILRHKRKQISFLHVFHHMSVPIIADYGYTQATWPAFTLIGSMNSFIHVIMYGYYGLTAFYPVRNFWSVNCWS